MSYSSTSWRCPYRGVLKNYSIKYYKKYVTEVNNKERLPCKCCGKLLSASDTQKLKDRIFGKRFLGALSD